MARRFLAVIALLLAACAAPVASGTPAPVVPSASSAGRTDAVGNVLPPTSDPAVWAVLAARPLQVLPIAPGATCPASSFTPLTNSATAAGAGEGPIYSVVGGTAIGLGAAAADGLRPGKVLWAARPEYTGVALIRGRRLDGPGETRFTGGAAELRFDLDTRTIAGTAQPDSSRITHARRPSHQCCAEPDHRDSKADPVTRPRHRRLLRHGRSKHDHLRPRLRTANLRVSGEQSKRGRAILGSRGASAANDR